MELSIATRVPVPVHETFLIVRDLGYMIPRIDPKVVSVARVGSGPIGIGTRWTETVRALPGLTVRVSLEVTAYVHDSLVGIHFNSRVMTGTGRTLCESSDNGTRITVEFEASATGAWRLFAPLVYRVFAARERRRIAVFSSMVRAGELSADAASPL